jgi:hypothetical protein
VKVMPLSGIESYPPTMQEFIAHWTTVNAAQPQPLVLIDGTTAATLATMRDEVMDKISAANQAVEAHNTARATYQAQRARVYSFMDMFRRASAYRLAGKPYASRVPVLPRVVKDDADMFKAGDEILYVWGQANADGPTGTEPLLLQDGTTLADFNLNSSQLRHLQGLQANAEGAADTARAKRDELLPQVKTLLLDYRKAILSLFARDSVAVQTLPAVTSAKTQKVAVNP